MHARKTGALIRASAVSGAIMAGADDDAASPPSIGTPPRSASRFRSSTTSSTSKATPAALGKTAGKDAAGDKPTYPALFGLERSRALAAECVAARARSARRTRDSTDGWLGAIADWVVDANEAECRPAPSACG